MNNHPDPRLVMLGAAGGTHGGIASAIEAYRAQGLFKRWAIDPIAIHGGRGPLDSALMSARGLRRFTSLLARQRRPVLHAHSMSGADFWRASLFIGVAAAAGCRVILQLHGGGFERFYDESSTPARALIRACFERAAWVLAPCESQRAWVQGLARGARTVCLPPPVQIAPLAAHEDRSSMVLFLGRLEQAKGVFDLLEAMASLRAAVPDVRLVCAGEGDRAGVARYAERLGIADAVKFTGAVGPSGKRALLESAAALALPSYAEGLPVSLLEAMSAGVPVVASPVGGIPEVVVDGVTGFLAAPGDTAALSRLLRKLLLDRALGARIGAAARESVRLRFAPERAIARLEEIYADTGMERGEQPAPAGVAMRKAA
jgi:glycosyltransferase involved in cell wall biosynthesis